MNSVKFTPSGGRVKISSQRGAEAATIVVTDTGQGIAPEALPHVFEPFRQEDSSSTRAQGGLGLGLTLVRRLVELHGGTVVAESSGKGRGATFTVTLPLPASRQKVDTREVPRSTDGSGGRRTLAGARILVVDDDPEFLDLSAMVLRRAGADVRAVSSAARAYELVISWLPNVLLTDLAMPGEDGFMLASAMRTIFTQRRVPVSIIAVTAYGTQESRARAILAGFDLFLTKPVDPADLARGRAPSTAAKRSASVRMRCSTTSPPRRGCRSGFPSCARRCQYGPWLASPFCGVDRGVLWWGVMPPGQARPAASSHLSPSPGAAGAGGLTTDPARVRFASTKRALKVLLLHAMASLCRGRGRAGPEDAALCCRLQRWLAQTARQLGQVEGTAPGNQGRR